MANNEKKAVVVFDNGVRFSAQISAEAIERKVEAEKANSLPVIKVHDEHGRDVWINANHIIAFQEYVSDDTPLAGFD
jgi:phage terminase large subunit